MKIAVIDDERPARKELIHQILDNMPDSQIEEADSGAKAIELISCHSFDLLFIDISLGDMEGTTLAAAARRILPDAQIVFATAYSQYAVKAFEIGVNNYILKPFDPDRVCHVLEKCRQALAASARLALAASAGQTLTASAGLALAASAGQALTASAGRTSQDCPDIPAPAYMAYPSGRMAINMNRTIVLIDIQQIVYIETSGRSCIIHTSDREYTENLLLGEYEKRLTPHGFCRIHKSFLVNLNYITEMFPWTNNSLGVKMQGFEKDVLPVSREKVKLLRQLVGA